MPLVPCAHDTTLKPPLGGGVFGTATTPVTAIGAPRTDVDEYITRYIVPCRPSTATGSDLISVPAVFGSGVGTA